MLIDCVEIAIDEYLLEQEYQNMIEDFRRFVQVTKPKHEIIYVVHNHSFTFYDSSFCRLTKEELLFYLKEELVFEQGIEIDEMVLSPLVSLAPKKLHVFSDIHEHGVILSLQAIFQERMSLFPLKSFAKH